MDYRVIVPVRYDNVRYGVGELAPRMPKAECDRLVNLGAIEVIGVIPVDAEEQTEEPKPTKAELIAQAEALGIEVPKRATNDELAALIAAAQASDAGEGEEAGDGLPSGVDPNLQG